MKGRSTLLCADSLILNRYLPLHFLSFFPPLLCMSLQRVGELEQEVKKSEENAIQIEQKYKQQIIELGLKRDEEKQKLTREHENQVRPLLTQYIYFLQ